MEMLLYNGKIYLERERFAEAVFIRDGIIQQVGSMLELILQVSTGCEKLDCGSTFITENPEKVKTSLYASGWNQIILKKIKNEFLIGTIWIKYQWIF